MIAAAFLLASSLTTAADPSCVVIRSLRTGQTTMTNPAECRVASTPASTFKIPNTLIALESGVDLDAMAKWDGVDYGNARWNRDQSLRTALRESAYWFYRDMARRLGEQKMREQFAKLKYAKDTFDGDHAAFWINGDLVVTPIEQVDFLERLARGKVDANPKNIATVRELIRHENGIVYGFDDLRLRWPAGTELRAKTGNASAHGARSSWLVGEVRCGAETLVFAARVRRPNGTLPRTVSVALAMRELNKRAPKSCR